MKITSQTFDLIELVLSLLHKIYQKLTQNEKTDKLSQQELLDYDFAIGQVPKIAIFIIQIIYYLDFTKLDPLQTSLLIQGFYIFAYFMVLVEQKYIYEGYSYTFHRIIAYRLMNIFFNGICLVQLHFLNQSLVENYENIKKLDLEIYDIIISGLVISTIVEIFQLLLQLSTRVFSCMKCYDNTQEYESKGGCVYICLGQFIGMAMMQGSIFLVQYYNNIPILNQINLMFIIMRSLVFFEFLLSCIFYCFSDKVKQDPPLSKKVLCFGYGFCTGSMGIIAGPALLGVLFTYTFLRTCCCCYQFKCRCIICCWCAKNESSHHYEITNQNQ